MTQEINIHSGVSHKHIVGFHGFFEDSNNVYILLELCRRRVRIYFCYDTDNLYTVHELGITFDIYWSQLFMIQLFLFCGYLKIFVLCMQMYLHCMYA